jgi:hypothetical protein
MRTSESFLGLIEELEGDARELERILGHNRRAWARIEGGASDPIDWGALGFTLHSAYGVLENYFLRVSKFFENNLDAERWHKALVEKMGLEIPGVRPALLSEERAKRQALELLKFRHRFRNLYGEDLDPAKTAEIQGIAEEFFPLFARLHADFIAKLRVLAQALA